MTLANLHRNLQIIFLATTISGIVFSFGCSDDVEFVSRTPTLQECTDSAATECQIVEPSTAFKKTFLIDEEVKRKADILFIVDTSGSMRHEQENIRKRFSTFIESLENVDWRVAISTAIIDGSQRIVGSAGTLIPFGDSVGAPTALDASVPGATELFKQTIRRPKSCGIVAGKDTCNDHERAIYQANLLIERAKEHEFFRIGSDVHIVIVSDEDEKSNGENLEELDLPETLIKNAAKLGASNFTVHSIIARPGDEKCLDGKSQGQNYGHTYKRIAELTGGVVGNVCDTDYTYQLATIASNITRTAQALELPCALQEPPMVSSLPALDGSFSFSLRSNNTIAFNKALPGGTQIVVDGTCKPTLPVPVEQVAQGKIPYQEPKTK